MIRYYCDNCQKEINEAQAKAVYPVAAPSSGMNIAGMGDRWYCALIVRKDHDNGSPAHLCWNCAGLIFNAALAMYQGKPTVE